VTSLIFSHPILTQSTDRVTRLLSILEEWDGMISVSIYSANIVTDYPYLLSALTQCGCACSTRLSVHLVVGGVTHPYPINIMRNIALSNVDVFGDGVDLVSPYDIDFVPSPKLCQSVLYWGERMTSFDLPMKPRMYATRHDAQAVQRPSRIYAMNPADVNTPRLMLIVPAVEYKAKDVTADVKWPTSKSELLELMESGEIERFHPKFEGQEINFTRWNSAKIPFLHSPIRLQNEHYAWFSRSLHSRISSESLCDETFFDRGYNKIMCYFRLRALGFAPLVIPNAWVLHVPESEESITTVLVPSRDLSTSIPSPSNAVTAPRRRPTAIHYKRQYHYRICRQLTSLGWTNVSKICMRFCDILALRDRLSFLKSRKYMTYCYNDVIHAQGLLGEFDAEQLVQAVEKSEAWMRRQEMRKSKPSQGDVMADDDD
jgi:hypothetical protein